MADPTALQTAVAAAQAVEFIGLPEARINLAQAVIHLALAPKSNAVIKAHRGGGADVRAGLVGPVPAHLRDAHYLGRARSGHGEGYLYPHDFAGGIVAAAVRPRPGGGPRLLRAVRHGLEARVAERAERIRAILGAGLLTDGRVSRRAREQAEQEQPDSEGSGMTRQTRRADRRRRPARRSLVCGGVFPPVPAGSPGLIAAGCCRRARPRARLRPAQARRSGLRRARPPWTAQASQLDRPNRSRPAWTSSAPAMSRTSPARSPRCRTRPRHHRRPGAGHDGSARPMASPSPAPSSGPMVKLAAFPPADGMRRAAPSEAAR